MASSYPSLADDPIARAYEEGLRAGQARVTLAPHLVPMPASPGEPAASQTSIADEFSAPPAVYEDTRDRRTVSRTATIPVASSTQRPATSRDLYPTALHDITNLPNPPTSTFGGSSTSAKPYYSARPSDIQRQFPATSRWQRPEPAAPPDLAAWRPPAQATASSSQNPLARRPPTPHPARAGGGRTLHDYDELPWLLSPTRRGILSQAASTRAAASSDYAGTSTALNTGRTYTSRLATLEPYAPQRLAFTPAPAQGWDTIHRIDPEELLGGVDPEKLAGLLEEDPNSTVMVRLYGVRHPTPNQVREATENLTTLTREATRETGFKIIPPDASAYSEGTQRGEPPVWAIVRLSRGAAQRFVNGQVFSSQLLSAFTAALDSSPGRFLFNLGGFTHDDDGDIIRTVWETFNGPQILPSIIRLARGNPAFSNMSPEEAASVVLASLEVQVSTLDNGNLVAAVFCDSPTASTPLWRQWRDNMLGIRFRSLFNSTATVRRPSRCGGCHSASHLTHLCPFPAVPGWYTAPPADRDLAQSQRPTLGRNTAQGDPNAPARFQRAPRGRGGNTSRGAPRRRMPERRGGRDDHDQSGYDAKDSFNGGGHGFDHHDYV